MEQYTIQLFSDSPYEFFKECVLSKDEIKKCPTIQDIIDLDNGEDNSIIPLRYKNVEALYEVLTTYALPIGYKLENAFHILEAVDFLGNSDHTNIIMDDIRNYLNMIKTFLSIEQKEVIRNGVTNLALSLQYYLLCGLCTIDIEYEVTVSNKELKYSNNLDYLLLIDHDASAKGCVVYNRGQQQPVDENSEVYCNIGHMRDAIMDNGDIYIFSAIFNSNASWLERSVNNYKFMQYYADNCYRKNRLVRVIDGVQPKILLVSTNCDKFMTENGNIWLISDLQIITNIDNIIILSPTMKTIIHNIDKGIYNITTIDDEKFKTVEVTEFRGEFYSDHRQTDCIYYGDIGHGQTVIIFSPNEKLLAEITEHELTYDVRIITNEGHVKSKTKFPIKPLLLTNNYLVTISVKKNKIYLEIHNISGTKGHTVPCYSQSIAAPQDCAFGNVTGRAGPNDSFLLVCTINPRNSKLRSQKWVRKYKIRKFVDTAEFVKTLD